MMFFKERTEVRLRLVLRAIAAILMFLTLVPGCQEDGSTVKVFGGTRAQANQYASVVSIRRPDLDAIHCTGTFIRDDLVLTAAVCVDFAVRNTNNCGYTFSVEVDGKNVSAQGIFIHPGYQARASVNDPTQQFAENIHDLALILLPPGTSKNVTPLEFETVVNAEDTVTMVGYGFSSQNRHRGLGTRNYVQTTYKGEIAEWKNTVVPLKKLRRMSVTQQQQLSGTYYSINSNTQGENAGVKWGDGGGPLLRDNKIVGVLKYAARVYSQDHSYRSVGVYVPMQREKEFITQGLQIKPAPNDDTCINNDYWLGTRSVVGVEDLRFVPAPQAQNEPSRPAISFTWDGIPNYHYAFNIELRDGEVITPCIGADVIGTATSGPFNGTCITQNNRQVDLNNVKQVTMLGALNGNFQDGPTQTGSLVMPVPLNLDEILHITIGNNQPVAEDETIPASETKPLPSELSFTWDRHQNYDYSFGLELKNGQIIDPCVGENIIGNLTDYKINGSCTTAGNRQVTYDQIKSVIIIAALNGDWEQGNRLRGTRDLAGIDLRTTIHIKIQPSGETSETPQENMSTLAITWDTVSNYTYQLDLVLKDGTVIAPCINSASELQATPFVFSGNCSARLRDRVAIPEIKSVTINAYGSGYRKVYASGTKEIQNLIDTVYVAIPIKVDVIGDDGAVTPPRTVFSKAETITLRFFGVNRDNIIYCTASNVAGLDICDNENNNDSWVGLPQDSWVYQDNIWSFTFQPDTINPADFKIFVKDGASGRRNNPIIHTVE